MDKIAINVLNWKDPQLIITCVNSLLDTFEYDTTINVCLNEYNKEAAEYLSAQKNVNFIALQKNIGWHGLDMFNPVLDSEYVCIINDDQIFHPGWQKDLITIIESDKYPCSASCSLVEPYGTGNPIVSVDNLGEFYNAQDSFRKNVAAGKYDSFNKRSFVQPMLVKTTDFFNVGGYTYNFTDGFGIAGYAGDDYYAYRLNCLHNNKFQFITSGKSHAYHGISMSTVKLPHDVKNFDVNSTFKQRTGMFTWEFRQYIGGWGSEIA